MIEIKRTYEWNGSHYASVKLDDGTIVEFKKFGSKIAPSKEAWITQATEYQALKAELDSKSLADREALEIAATIIMKQPPQLGECADDYLDRMADARIAKLETGVTK